MSLSSTLETTGKWHRNFNVHGFTFRCQNGYVCQLFFHFFPEKTCFNSWQKLAVPDVGSSDFTSEPFADIVWISEAGEKLLIVLTAVKI